MATKRKEEFCGQRDQVDRISDLPEYILHHILSFLDTEEACRTSILCKKWSSVWDTVPFLDFHPYCFMKGHPEFQSSSPPSKFNEEYYKKYSIDRYVNFIDRTMQRYSKQNLSIQKLKLTLPVLDPELACFMDSWLRIAVQNHIEYLNISLLFMDLQCYRLPEILFSAKSLKFLKCCKVKLPCYQGMKLTSLQTLNLDTVFIDEGMLQRIISSCPLIDLELSSCFGLENISVPSLSKLGCLKVWDVDVDLNFNQETGSLQSLVFRGLSWPCKINAGALRNLKELKIYRVHFADEVILNLMAELTLVDTLGLYECYTFQNLNIKSNRLKELDLQNCDDLENVVIDAPNLALFSFKGYLETSLSFTNIRPQCDAYFHICGYFIHTSWFVNLKEFMVKSNICKVLNVVLPSNRNKSNVNVHELMKILVEPAYELREIKLSQLSRIGMPTQSSLSAFLDGLFFICHPATLSISTCLDFDNTFVKSLKEILENKVKCWHDPLKGVQVESIGCLGLNKYESGDDMDLKFYFRLCW